MSRPEEKWSCSTCTYDNYQASLKCSLCLNPRASEIIRLPPVNKDAPSSFKTNAGIQSSSRETYLSDFIISPPGCSSNNNHSKDIIPTSTVDRSKNFLIKIYDDHPSTSNSNKSWPCAFCSFASNSSRQACCSQCHTPKNNTILNSAAATGTSSVVSNVSSPPEMIQSKCQKWSCLVCTYENWNASKKCVMCHFSREATVLSTSEEAQSSQPESHHITSDLAGTSSKMSNLLLGENLFAKFPPVIDENSKCSGDQSHTNLSQFMSDFRQEYKSTRTIRSLASSSNESYSSRDGIRSPSFSPAHRPHWNSQRDVQATGASSVTTAGSSQRNNTISEGLPRSNSSSHLHSPSRLEIFDSRSIKNRMRNLNWRFLKACIGVVDGNAEAVDAYLAYGGNIARTLTLDEVNSLNRPSAFDIGHTLVHLAIRFQRHNILAQLLTPEIASRGFKRNPSHLSPDLAHMIQREILASLRTRTSDFRCKFLSECITFQLPIEICNLPPSIQTLLFNELLDQDVQKELEEESAINFSPSLLKIDGSNNQLYALWNRSAGDCLLDSVLQATWGVFDRDNILRTAMSQSLQECTASFFKRWRNWELYQADLLGFALTERQCMQDWTFIHSLAQQPGEWFTPRVNEIFARVNDRKEPGASLEHCHIFVLSHVLRRPIIVYGIKYLKSFQGDTLGFAKFQGVYLPFLWDQSFCFTSPIALGYTRGHFTALVTMENDVKNIGSKHRHPFNSVKNLPLVDSDGKILPIHFTSRDEGINEEERKEILQEWLDCHVTADGLLVAKQRPGKRPPSVTRLIDEWLDHYRHLSFRWLGETAIDFDEDEE